MTGLVPCHEVDHCQWRRHPYIAQKQGFPTRFLRAPSSIPSRLFQRPLSESCIFDSYLGLGRGALSSWFAQKIRHDGESIGDDEGSFPGRWSGKRVLHKISTFSDNGHLFGDKVKSWRSWLGNQWGRAILVFFKLWKVDRYRGILML